MNRRREAIAIAVLVGLLAGCRPGSEGAGDPSRLEPTLASIQRNIFDIHCSTARCHGGAASESELALTAGRSHEALVNVASVEIRDLMRVAPYDPDHSYLIRKLEGKEIVGEIMPLGKEPLPAASIDAIRRWIANGAGDR